MSYLKNLSRVLEDCCPKETVLVTASRALGRRMLTACAAEGTLLVGVRAETPFTLARELSSGWLSRPGAPRLAEDSHCIELVRECLKQLKDPAFFKGETGTGLGAAEALYQTFSELKMACVDQISGNEKLDEIEKLRRAYEQKKREAGLVDRTDLFGIALEQAKNSPLRRAAYVMLASYAPKPLEKQLILALSGEEAKVVEMAFPAGTEQPAGLIGREMEQVDVLPGLRNRTTFVRCRGVETEVNYIFRDILEKKLPVGECAVVYLGEEYARKLYEAAGRYSLPVSMGAGVSLTGSSLYTGLKMISRLPEFEYNAEKVMELLSGTGCAPAGRWQLMDALRAKKIGWGKERYQNWESKYAPDEKGRPSDETLADWNRCFALMFGLSGSEGELAQQKTNLLEFITGYYKPVSPEQGSAYAQTLRLIEQITQLGEGESLLNRLLASMEKSNYLFGSAVEGTLFCSTLSQGLCTGRRHLYVVGLSRYALQGSTKESPILLDEERLAWPSLKRVPDREAELTFRFLEMLLHHAGSVVLTYSDFDSDSMLSQLPAPLYRQAMEACGGTEICVDYLKSVKTVKGGAPTVLPWQSWCGADELLNSARPPILNGPDAVPAGDGEVAELNANLSLKQQIKDYVFSPSSLEMALNCPLQFYYQKLLKIYPADKLERRDGYWVEKNTIGTFCHRVLERYYAEQATDVTPIFEEEKKLLLQEYPSVRQRDMDAAFQRMRAMVDVAIEWTTKHNITVLSTEANFGKEKDGVATKGLKLKIGSRELLLTGSVDRVDQRADGSCTILDYKTGNSDFFIRDMDKHLQHYLYTLAEEELYKEQGRKIQAATYLFLEEQDKCVEIPQDQAVRGGMEELIQDLLEQMENEDTAQMPCPGFKYDQNANFVPDDLAQRQEAQESCRKYCKYAALCPDVK